MTQIRDTDLIGNTSPDQIKSTNYKIRGRNFLLTVNEKSIEYIEDIFDYLQHWKTLQYLICCEHIGQENKHYHIFVQYNNPINMDSNYLKGCHIDKCFGSPQQNYNYVKALDEKHIKLNIESKLIFEIGEMKKTGTTLTYSEFKKMSIEEREALPYQHSKIINQLNEEQHEEEELKKVLTEIENDNLKSPEIIYLTGESGQGKTYGAYKLALKYFNKDKIGKININNNFFKIVNQNADCYIIEEFRSSQLHASDFLQFTDKYGFNCNIKNGFKFLRPKMIIICSIIHPRELYINEEVNKQFLRRITKCYKLINHELIEDRINDTKFENDGIEVFEEDYLNDINDNIDPRLAGLRL